ncbi:hypothetical protein CXR26_17130 [Brevibacterium aurantiacum]|nr:hypothetical protein CXR26_17035 [Brevibacterium aurantiacum]AZL10745.1 hypothetical protein CXR26_17130 [Brevibacterium aurantiacum]
MITTDIAIIGSGASGTHCLLQILDHLESSSDPIRITVIDRDSQFHSGIPYGHRSGPSSLLITKLSDFLSHSELISFKDWLDEHHDAILATSKLDRDWLDRHGDDIRHGRWEDLYLPRRLYGRYLRSQAESAIRRAAERHAASVDYLTAEISDVIPQEDGSAVLRGDVLSSDGVSTIEVCALRTVLSVGSPPVRALSISAETCESSSAQPAHQQVCGYVDDIHAPTIEDVIAGIGEHLESVPSQQRRILVVGGNADALEFVLASSTLRQSTGASLSVLSPRGRPYYWRHERPDERPELGAVQALLDGIDEGVKPTAREFSLAVEADITDSIAHRTDKATVSAIMDSVGQVIGHMDETELAEMAGTYGLRISNLLRQAGGDAIDLLDAASGESTVTFESGRFVSAIQRDGLFTVSVRNQDAERTGSDPLPQEYAVIVNATGFEAVSESRSPLLQNLLRSGVATTSCSGAGLATDCSFRTAPGTMSSARCCPVSTTTALSSGTQRASIGSSIWQHDSRHCWWRTQCSDGRSDPRLPTPSRGHDESHRASPRDDLGLVRYAELPVERREPVLHSPRDLVQLPRNLCDRESLSQAVQQLGLRRAQLRQRGVMNRDRAHRTQTVHEFLTAAEESGEGQIDLIPHRRGGRQVDEINPVLLRQERQRQQ